MLEGDVKVNVKDLESQIAPANDCMIDEPTGAFWVYLILRYSHSYYRIYLTARSLTSKFKVELTR